MGTRPPHPNKSRFLGRPRGANQTRAQKYRISLDPDNEKQVIVTYYGQNIPTPISRKNWGVTSYYDVLEIENIGQSTKPWDTRGYVPSKYHRWPTSKSMICLWCSLWDWDGYVIELMNKHTQFDIGVIISRE